MPSNLIPSATGAAALSIQTIIINLAVAFILSLLVALVYRATHRGLSYSQGFTVSLILIGFLIASVVMVIGNSLALAFAGFGAMSLIRFRTAIKDARDIAFVLLAVAVGMGAGTGNYLLAGLTALIAIIAAYVLYKMNFGSIRKYDYVLSFSAQSADFVSDRLREVFAEFLKYDNLLNVAAREGGKAMDYSFNVRFINAQEIDKFARRVSELPGVSDIDILSAKNDIEY